MYTLWTLDPITGEMDDRIAIGIDDIDEANQRAENEADRRDRVVVILRDGDHFSTVYPDDIHSQIYYS